MTTARQNIRAPRLTHLAFCVLASFASTSGCSGKPLDTAAGNGRSGSSRTVRDGGGGVFCGDGLCGDLFENCASCPRDCGACGTICGNANYAVPCGDGLCPSFAICSGSTSCECQPGYRWTECSGVTCDTPTGQCGWCVPSGAIAISPDAGTTSCPAGFDWNGARCAASAGSQFSGFNGLWPRGAVAELVVPVNPVTAGGQSRLWEYFHQRPGSCNEALVIGNNEAISGSTYRFFTRPANLPPNLMGTRVPCVGDGAAIGGDGRSLLMRTGANGQIADLWWRAPVAGRYEISVTFSFPVATRNVTTAFVYGPVPQQLFRQVPTGPTLTYSGTATLRVGEAIAFQIQSSSGYRGDVGISATIFPL